MKGRTGGGLLLLLGIPFGLFVAWQVNGVVRTDLIASDAPADRGMTKEQLGVAKAKMSALSAEVRKAVAVAWQYRDLGPDDATADTTVDGVVKASAVRSKELKDLDHFLAGVEGVPFTGKLKESYRQWKVGFAQAERDEREVKKWLESPPSITSAADAVKAMAEANGLIAQYIERSNFADKAKTAQWRVRARLLVAKALAERADEQYRGAVGVKLPLKPGTNAVKNAIQTLDELKRQIDSLNEAVKQANEEKVTLDGALRGEIDAQGAVSDQCKASLELLTLFGREDLITNATGAAAWLKQVGDQYGNTKDVKVKALIREKVQEFCEAYIPTAVRLDDMVRFKTTVVQRKDVVVEYEPLPGAVAKQTPLTSDVDGVNEFNVAKKFPGKSTEVRVGGVPGYPRDLTPTELSEAAVLYTNERKKVGDGATGPKWTAKSVDQLKKQCEAQKELVDQLKGPRSGMKDEELKLATRLQSLFDGLKAAPALVGDEP